MRILCIFLPPVAVYLCDKPGQAVLNFFLCLLFWIPGVIHAWLVVSKRNQAAEYRVQRQEDLRQAAAWDEAHPMPQPAPPPGWSVEPPVESTSELPAMAESVASEVPAPESAASGIEAPESAAADVDAADAPAATSPPPPSV